MMIGFVVARIAQFSFNFQVYSLLVVTFKQEGSSFIGHAEKTGHIFCATYDGDK